MATYKKFYDDVYLKEYTSKITVCKKPDANDCKAHKALVEKGLLLSIELEETIFFPTGGGQSCDLGTINGYKLIDVDEVINGDEEHIYHYISFEDTVACEKAAKDLKEGMDAKLLLDWDRRFDNMQRHCGEHITSGIFYREYGGVNRGFHMGEDYMTIDISLEDDPRYTELTFEMCKHIEMCANEVIWSNAPVIRRVYAKAEECKDLPLRKALAIEENISIVCVGSIENAADCVACCGTHPSTAGQVGLIKIFKVEPNKGMFRVYCEAGRRAFKDYEFKHDVYTYLANRYSATQQTLFEQIARDDAKIQTLRDEYYQLKRSVIAERSARINDEMSKLASTPEGKAKLADSVLVYEYNDLKIEDLLLVGKELDRSLMAKLVLLVNYKENSVALLSDGKTCKCGMLVKDNAGIYGGKGGGRDDNARAMFTSRESVNTFIDLLEKHLR